MGAPRVHGELLKLGFHVSEPTVSRWLRRAPRAPDPAQRWLTFLRNHREAIAAMDFFTVPTITIGVLYCFFAIGHERRMREAWPYAPAHKFLLFDRDAKILHFNVTRNPSASWIVHQMVWQRRCVGGKANRNSADPYRVS